MEGWRKSPLFTAGPYHPQTLGHADSLEVGEVTRAKGFGSRGASSQMPGLRTLARSQAGLPGTACSPVGTAGPRPLGGSSGGGAELTAAAGTDSLGRKPGQARQDF